MKNSGKFSLSNIRVQSFVTSLPTGKALTVKGGDNQSPQTIEELPTFEWCSESNCSAPLGCTQVFGCDTWGFCTGPGGCQSHVPCF